MEQTELTEEMPQEQAMETEEVPAEEMEREPDCSRFASHIQGLEAQAMAMQQQFPDFDLREALQNPVFLQLTAPGTGISVEDAYYALHRKEIQQSAVRQTREQVVQAIQSGSRRPLEAGTTSQGPSLVSFHYDSASKEQREAFKKELRRAWGRGETVYP